MKSKLVYLIGAVVLAFGAAATLLTTLSANAATVTASSVTWTDNFNSASLDSRWSWIRQDATHWSLTAQPGFMRITTQSGGLLFQPTNAAKNLLLQDIPIGDFEIHTLLAYTPTENFQGAGLLVYQDDDNFLYCNYSAYLRLPPPVAEMLINLWFAPYVSVQDVES
jgi:beta-xylosidase